MVYVGFVFIDFFHFPLLHSSEKTARHRRQFPVFCGLIVWFWMHPAKKEFAPRRFSDGFFYRRLSFAVSTNQMRDLLCWSIDCTLQRVFSQIRGGASRKLLAYFGIKISFFPSLSNQDTRKPGILPEVSPSAKTSTFDSAIRICVVFHSSFLSPREKTIATPTVIAMTTPI